MVSKLAGEGAMPPQLPTPARRLLKIIRRGSLLRRGVAKLKVFLYFNPSVGAVESVNHQRWLRFSSSIASSSSWSRSAKCSSKCANNRTSRSRSVKRSSKELVDPLSGSVCVQSLSVNHQFIAFNWSFRSRSVEIPSTVLISQPIAYVEENNQTSFWILCVLIATVCCVSTGFADKSKRREAPNVTPAIPITVQSSLAKDQIGNAKPSDQQRSPGGKLSSTFFILSLDCGKYLDTFISGGVVRLSLKLVTDEINEFNVETKEKVELLRIDTTVANLNSSYRLAISAVEVACDSESVSSVSGSSGQECGSMSHLRGHHSSVYFVTDNEKVVVEYENCKLLLVDKEIANARVLTIDKENAQHEIAFRLLCFNNSADKFVSIEFVDVLYCGTPMCMDGEALDSKSISSGSALSGQECLEEKAARLPPIEEVRTVLGYSLRGVLSTFSQKHEGYPSGSMVDFACDAYGSPILATNSLAVHSKDPLANPKCSLLVAKDPEDRTDLVIIVTGAADPGEVLALRVKDTLNAVKEGIDCWRWMQQISESVATVLGMQHAKPKSSFVLIGLITEKESSNSLFDTANNSLCESTTWSFVPKKACVHEVAVQFFWSHYIPLLEREQLPSV
nr:Cellular repressor of transcription [Ipomoea batatas]GMD34421.1 Cellular repressor of transcription [Ipomoea batatas]